MTSSDRLSTFSSMPSPRRMGASGSWRSQSLLWDRLVNCVLRPCWPGKARARAKGASSPPARRLAWLASLTPAAQASLTTYCNASLGATVAVDALDPGHLHVSKGLDRRHES